MTKAESKLPIVIADVPSIDCLRWRAQAVRRYAISAAARGLVQSRSPSAKPVPVKAVLSCRKYLRGNALMAAKKKPGNQVRNAYSVVPSLNSEKLT